MYGYCYYYNTILVITVTPNNFAPMMCTVIRESLIVFFMYRPHIGHYHLLEFSFHYDTDPTCVRAYTHRTYETKIPSVKKTHLRTQERRHSMSGSPDILGIFVWWRFLLSCTRCRIIPQRSFRKSPLSY